MPDFDEVKPGDEIIANGTWYCVDEVFEDSFFATDEDGGTTELFSWDAHFPQQGVTI